jgi:hypothetical protein
MILDAIIGLFTLIFDVVVQSVASVTFPIVNLIAAGIEAVVGLFISGFRLGRMERRERKQHSRADGIRIAVFLLILISAVGWFVVAPAVMNRTITLVAKDGHSLPFAALIVHTDGGNRHERTDRAGNIAIPRFGTKALTIMDPRYVEQTWQIAEIRSELIVSRTALGASLDSLADRLLKPAKE